MKFKVTNLQNSSSIHNQNDKVLVIAKKSPIYKIRLQYTTFMVVSVNLPKSPIYKIRLQYTTGKPINLSHSKVTNLQNSYSISLE